MDMDTDNLTVNKEMVVQKKANLQTDQENKQISELAAEVIRLAHNGILMNLRFFDAALAELVLEERGQMGAHCFDGIKLYYDPVLLLSRMKKEPHYAARLYLHVLLHCIFYHGFRIEKLERELWDLATDIAVENTILELQLSFTGVNTDVILEQKLAVLRKQAGGLSAEKLYRHFRIEPPSNKALLEWKQLCHYDEHIYWDWKEERMLPPEQWQKISERIKADLKSFSKDKNNSESMEENLREATRERYDYGAFLRRFMVLGESIQINDEEFDYIYYTYGLSHYGNMPLIEPLEYKDANKIRDFVIAIDTSASCRGKIVQSFLQKTYQIMQSRENFFHKINVHIIQCDSEVRSDTVITCKEDFDRFITEGRLVGFGSTDFRPVFRYVEKLKEEGGFDRLKGLIYFTDGYGIYPEQMPDYDTAFVFLQRDDQAPTVPPWAIRIILEEEQLEE